MVWFNVKMFISSVFSSAPGIFAKFCHFNACHSKPRATVNLSPTSGDFALLKIMFVQAPPCLTCATHARGSCLT